MPDEKKAPRTVKPFAAILQEIGKGRAHLALSEAMNELNAAVRDHGKKGSLSITINVAPLKGTDDQFDTTVTFTSKLPQAEHTSIFYIDADANLTRENPEQPSLPLRLAEETA